MSAREHRELAHAESAGFVAGWTLGFLVSAIVYSTTHDPRWCLLAFFAVAIVPLAVHFLRD